MRKRIVNLRQTVSDLMWGIYGRRAWDSASNQRTQDLIDKLTAHLLRLRRIPDELVLDAGCGTGNYALSFARAGFQVRGIDSARGMVQVARKKISGLQTQRLSFERLSLNETLPYGDSTFDHIVCVSVLQLLTNLAFTLSEFARLLKSYGHLTVVHFDRSSHPSKKLGSGSLKEIQRQANLRARLLVETKRLIERSRFDRDMTYTTIRNMIEQVGFRITAEENGSPKILVAMKQ
jgi:ubiquinone/menaquinone biosynthesis C-methylase UbiE